MVREQRFSLNGINANTLYDRLKRNYPVDVEFENADDKQIFDSFEQLVWQNGCIAEFDANNGTFELRDRKTGEVKRSTKLKPHAKFFTWDLADSNMARQLDAIVSVRALTPQHSYSELVRGFAIKNADDKIVCRCEISETTSVNASPITQIIVSPLRGYLEDANSLCKWLTEHHCTPATTEQFYKQITGFADNRAYFNVKPAIPIKPETPARTAAYSIIDTMLSVSAKTEAGVIDDIDSEFLHDYRVCMRKIRSVLSLMKNVFTAGHTDALKQAFREIASETNRLRDLDVYLLGQQVLTDMLPDTLARGLEVMFKDFAERRRLEQERIAKFFASAAYKQKIRHAKQLLVAAKRGSESQHAKTPAYQLAKQEIGNRYKKINRIGRKITGTAPDEQVHELRIECKKLRYLLEFYQPLLPQEHAEQFVKRLKKLQTCLGDFNDYAVQQQSLLDYVVRANSRPGKKEVALAVGGLIAILNQKQQVARSKVQSLFAEFDSKPTRDSMDVMFTPEQVA